MPSRQNTIRRIAAATSAELKTNAYLRIGLMITSGVVLALQTHDPFLTPIGALAGKGAIQALHEVTDPVSR